MCSMKKDTSCDSRNGSSGIGVRRSGASFQIRINRRRDLSKPKEIVMINPESYCTEFSEAIHHCVSLVSTRSPSCSEPVLPVYRTATQSTVSLVISLAGFRVESNSGLTGSHLRTRRHTRSGSWVCLSRTMLNLSTPCYTRLA